MGRKYGHPEIQELTPRYREIFIKGGYLAWSRVFMIIFNVSVAGFLLIIGLPVFLIVGSYGLGISWKSRYL